MQHMPLPTKKHHLAVLGDPAVRIWTSMQYFITAYIKTLHFLNLELNIFVRHQYLSL